MKSYFLLLRYALILSMVVLSGGIVAQQKPDGNALLYFVAKDTVQHEIIGYFYNIRGPMYSDPEAPRFIIASRNQNLLLGIGGYVQLRGSYDFRGVCESDDFYAYDIPVPNAGNPTQALRMNAGSSRLFMRLLANTKRVGRLTAYIEADFLGDSRAFRLRQANISFLGFTFGQALTTFVDGKAYAPSLDQNGGIVALNQRNPLIRYERSFGKGFRFAVAAEFPSFSGSYQDGITAKATAQIPDFPAYIQYKWKNNHIRLTGMIRDLPYKDVLHNSYHRVFGVGGKVSGVVQLAPALQGMFYASYGKGMATYSLDLAGAGMDLLSDYNRPGQMFAPRTAVYYGGFRIDFSPHVYSGLTYSFLRLYTKDSFTDNPDFDASTFYKYGQSATAAIIWKFLPAASCGLEYMWGERTNYDGQSGHANRLYATIRYNF
ncbi:MAG: DcaP family trimeric outer membrane transporter [Bacteroidales bacterium]